MTKMVKLAITLPPEQVALAKRAVAEGQATSVSAFISQAIAGQECRRSLSEVAAEWIATDGEPDNEAYAWADRVLGLAE